MCSCGAAGARLPGRPGLTETQTHSHRDAQTLRHADAAGVGCRLGTPALCGVWSSLTQPAQAAAAEGRRGAYAALVAAGGDAAARDGTGQTPAELAVVREGIQSSLTQSSSHH